MKSEHLEFWRDIQSGSGFAVSWSAFERSVNNRAADLESVQYHQLVATLQTLVLNSEIQELCFIKYT